MAVLFKHKGRVSGKTTKRKKARKVAKRSRRATSLGRHRPVVYRTKRGYRKSKRSKVFGSGRVIINPRYRRSRRRSNPFGITTRNLIPNKNFMLTASGTVLGFVVGRKIIPLMSKVPGLSKDGTLTKVGSIVSGALNVVIGGLAASKLKGELLKGVGVGIAGSGVIQILASILPAHIGAMLSADLSADGLPEGLSYGDDVVQIGDEMVQVGSDLSDDRDLEGESVYERI